MNKVREIFIALLDEGVDVWRPVTATHLHGDVYRIDDQIYKRDIETWQFVPGDEVVCEMIERSDGRVLAAVRVSGAKDSRDS